ncbi:hypothetical protein PPROV_000800800 [Pycnococcus provasolii]|uniref:THO complex subunit 1 n=1 Tax=Pycnococcus provasolii TaxID=41880 RepID=A0A830HUY3_9CHLO|nr:hypothetical protein PPROV_000800800 [Pycnococcus provasolii]
MASAPTAMKSAPLACDLSSDLGMSYASLLRTSIILPYLSSVSGSLDSSASALDSSASLPGLGLGLSASLLGYFSSSADGDASADLGDPKEKDTSASSSSALATLLASNSEHALLLQHALRSSLLDLMKKKPVSASSGTGTLSLMSPEVTALFDTTLALCASTTLDAGFIFTLFEDAFSYGTIALGKDIFAYLEKHSTLLAQPAFFNRGKLIILRICTSLLRRLSRANDAIFCGRIQHILACFFPLSDKSGTNKFGQYNAENITTVANDDADVVEDDEDDDEGAEGVDMAFYRSFWKLQDHFAQPNILATSAPIKVKEAMNDINAALKVLRAQEAATITSATAPADADEALCEVKYLTSPKLFKLQVRDANFRRHFLLQCLIMCHHLAPRTPLPRGTQPTAGLAPTLPPMLIKEVKSTLDAVYDALDASPGPAKQSFTKAVVDTIMLEEHWSAWKTGGCLELERTDAEVGMKGFDSVSEAAVKAVDEQMAPRAPAPAPAAPPKRKSAIMGMPAPKRAKSAASLGSTANLPSPPAGATKLGCDSLNRLWSIGGADGWGSRAASDTGDALDPVGTVPAIETWLEPVIDDMDPESGIEEEFKHKHDKTYVWKSLRLIARERYILASEATSSDIEKATKELGLAGEKMVE